VKLWLDVVESNSNARGVDLLQLQNVCSTGMPNCFEEINLHGELQPCEAYIVFVCMCWLRGFAALCMKAW
jgi:hypothetical protein